MYLYSFIFSSLALVIQLYYEKYRSDNLALTLTELEEDDNLPRIRIYDFIIVGGGGAGCVIANRLSKHYNVLLLESGGSPVPAAEVPILYEGVRYYPSINYNYTSIPQSYASLENGGIISQTFGKMLGGSTSHNNFKFNRGNPLDFDNWANITNDRDWEYKNVLTYFKKLEHYIGTQSQGTERGYHGLMTVDTVKSPVLVTWFDAAVELGFKTSLDPNGPQTESFSVVDVALKNGHRVSSYTAYIKPFEKIRKILRKLRIERYSQVSEVLINEEKNAYGVAYKRHQIPQIAHASKEIIISCGAFGSPLLLMKSGIGPLNMLKKAGIKVISDLPVGKTLFDHVIVTLEPFTFVDPFFSTSLEINLNEDSLNEYHKTGQGVIGDNDVVAQAHIVSSKAKLEGQSTWPDLQLLCDTRYNFTFYVSLTRPRSKGSLRLNTKAFKTGTSNDEELAVIDYNILSDPNDVDVLIEGIKLVLNVIENTQAFKKLGANFTGVSIPACSKFKFRSDEYWKCYVHQLASSRIHPVSTCKMGYGNKDKTGVVDSKFNVLGITNLKVVDASVLPIIPNSNIMAPVIMMAEKASEEILKFWKTNIIDILEE